MKPWLCRIHNQNESSHYTQASSKKNDKHIIYITGGSPSHWKHGPYQKYGSACKNYILSYTWLEYKHSSGMETVDTNWNFFPSGRNGETTPHAANRMENLPPISARPACVGCCLAHLWYWETLECWSIYECDLQWDLLLNTSRWDRFIWIGEPRVSKSLGCSRTLLRVHFKEMGNEVNKTLIPHRQTVPQRCLLRNQVFQPAGILKREYWDIFSTRYHQLLRSE